MTETKFEKINQFFYREPYKDESSFKWLKAFHPLDMKLTDVQVILGLSVQQPRAWNPFFWKEAEARASLTNDGSISSNEEAQEKYSDHIGWRLSATGYFIKDRIGLIKKDGTITNYREAFDQVDVVIRSVSDAEKEKAVGNFFYMNSEMAELEKRAAPWLTMELYAPETHLERLCREVLTSRVFELEVRVHADVFQSEVDATLGEPVRRRDYYIEEESIRNDTYLSTIDICQPSVSNRKESSSSGDLVAAHTAVLSAINARLANIRTVGLLFAVALLLILLLK